MPSQRYDRTTPVRHRVGGWLPTNQRVLEAWLDKKLQAVKQRNRLPNEWAQVIKDFQQVIESDGDIYMAFHQMFDQVPTKPPYNNDPTGQPQIRDYITMLDLFDLIIGEAPQYEDNDLVGFPINAILDWPMGTPAGFRAFTNPKVNEMFHKMFDVWATYLGTTDSAGVLNSDTGGWFSTDALQQMPDFANTYICDPSLPHWGFQSWDDFFTRLFRPGIRPVEAPDDDSIVNSACESTLYKTAKDIQQYDQFWLKDEPYSLYHMLNNDEYAEQFVGGSIWQAFLSATNYHRWASPVNGKIVKTVNIQGTYYAESPATGFYGDDGPDPAGPNLSQSFITAIAARALIFIEAANPNIGLMCFVAVGMAEVSTCEVTVQPGDTVKKGDQLGMFHFGGSTHCLIFRPETNIQFRSNFNVNDKVSLNIAIADVVTQ
ncbi:L-tryptophan decarboxylase [Psilocybe cubensis]|uniref:L-tryptophan decarboxylase PsiD-like domain-containing protein n=2 Tax=Psilocybe cubensis TaxID=181762 RepID=A0A8H8CRA1_PSICU|nr:L-tryptophan decarboxylase [Psilocybe cubensis]KAH9487443.1 L-tryptophan decarboxylase [Psilocybe cubensis]